MVLTCCSARSKHQGHSQVTCQSARCCEFNTDIEHTPFHHTGNGLERNCSICGGGLNWMFLFGFWKLALFPWILLCANGQIGYIFSGNLAEIFLIYICISPNKPHLQGRVRYKLLTAQDTFWPNQGSSAALGWPYNIDCCPYLSICFQNHSSLYLRSQLHVTTLCELQLGL